MTERLLRLRILDHEEAFARELLAGAGQLDIDASWVPHPPAPEWLARERFDAILVDPAVLGGEFWGWLEALTGRVPGLSVLVCGGRTDRHSRVRGLRLGADDWITKPMAVLEVLTRVEAARRGRRSAPLRLEQALGAGEIEMHPADLVVQVAGRPLDLTRREFELLHFLLGEQGMVLGREAIYERVWGYAMVVGDRSVDTYIRKLRIKLEAASPRRAYVHTHVGIGYRFEARPVEDAGGYAWGGRLAAPVAV